MVDLVRSKIIELNSHIYIFTIKLRLFFNMDEENNIR